MDLLGACEVALNLAGWPGQFVRPDGAWPYEAASSPSRRHLAFKEWKKLTGQPDPGSLAPFAMVRSAKEL